MRREPSGRVWYVLPCANEKMAARTLPRWRAMGYRIAVQQDRFRFPVCADVVQYRAAYGGYPDAVNRLARLILGAHPEVNVVVTGGDDMDPDPVHRADWIEKVYLDRFPDTFGVLQPTGDTLDGTDRICGSPWMGREFVRRWNGGAGPFWPEYFHYYCDEEMFNTTRAAGVLVQDPRICQHHHHFHRTGEPRRKHLELAHARWDDDKALFARRKSAGFPGSAPLP